MMVENLQEVIVVGGGAAGLMAAGQAAGSGARTLLLEKMDRPGRKLRITGKGRCNLTNIDNLDDFLNHFQPEKRFLRHAFHQFFSQELLDFFQSLGVDTVVERGGRVFPLSSDAQQVVDALTGWAETQGVAIRSGVSVDEITPSGQSWIIRARKRRRSGRGVSGTDERRMEFHADTVILATGGASYPGTGSTGDGYHMAAALGHKITPLRPALIPLDTAGDVASRLEGLSLRNVSLSLLVDDQKQAQEFGEMIFTQFGVSGPIVLTLSLQAVDALRNGSRVELSIDLKPALDHHILDARLLRELNAHGKRIFSTVLTSLLPRSLIPVCIDQTAIPADKLAHQITSGERKRLRLWLKDFRLTVNGHRPIAQAIVTAGGVATDEVDPRTMRSRLFPGLFFCGEVLDINADTGGYNLQAAFSTGWLAGRSAARLVAENAASRSARPNSPTSPD
jgi:predicted Rossmann fold flavoprotein